MEKSKIIDLFLAFLAPIVHDNTVSKGTTPQITFLSENEVKIDLDPGWKVAIQKTYEDNSLSELLQKVVNHNMYNERKHYLECLYTEDEEAAEKFDKEDIYDPDTVIGHIYHVLRSIESLISPNN